MPLTTPTLAVATKNIIRIDFVDFFATTIVRSLHEYYRPPPVLSTLLGLLQSRTLLHLEILALRQQLAMVNQTPRKRLRFHWGQRLFWVWLYRLWPDCLHTLQVFKPDTLVRWHRKGFRLYWTGGPVAGRGGAHPSHPRYANLSGRCLETTLTGVHRGFTANFSCSASTSPRRQLQSTWSIILSRHRRCGGPFWTIILKTWYQSTSSPCLR